MPISSSDCALVHCPKIIKLIGFTKCYCGGNSNHGHRSR